MPEHPARASKSIEREGRLIACFQCLDSQGLVANEPPKKRTSNGASGHRQVHCAGPPLVYIHDGRRYMRPCTQSRRSYQPVAGNHLDKVVAPAVATADADAHYLISGKTNCDRQVSRQLRGVRSLPSQWRRGDRAARRSHEENCERGVARCSARTAKLLRQHCLSTPKTLAHSVTADSPKIHI